MGNQQATESKSIQEHSQSPKNGTKRLKYLFKPKSAVIESESMKNELHKELKKTISSVSLKRESTSTLLNNENHLELLEAPNNVNHSENLVMNALFNSDDQARNRKPDIPLIDTNERKLTFQDVAQLSGIYTRWHSHMKSTQKQNTEV
ncbi:hypothetical protein HDV02_001800 [Globomyces sp. JEL0801]|nr:hypothetical protein HDV02_001800 [Globomyces sp. JEL0801]